MNHESNKILSKFIRRAFWMNNPNSNEFKLYFLEMVTELRRNSGRQFNADITLEDVKRTLTSLTDKYPILKNISLNTIFKTINTMESVSKAGDLFTIASAVSTSFLSIGMLFLGPLPYLLLKVFAPNRLKCGVIMGLGGLICIEIYNIQDYEEIKITGLKRRKEISISTMISGILLILNTIFIFYPGLTFFYKTSLIFTSFFILAFFIASLGFDIWKSKRFIKKISPNGTQFNFKVGESEDLETNFKLDVEESRFLYSILLNLIESNIESTQNSRIKGNKRIWLDHWKTQREAEIGVSLVSDKAIIDSTIFGEFQKLSRMKRFLMYMECALFIPFSSVSDLRLSIPEKGKFFSNKDLESLSKQMNINISPKTIQQSFYSALNSIGSISVISKIVESLFKISSLTTPIIIQPYSSLLKASVLTSLRLKKGRGDLLPPENTFFLGGGILLSPDMDNFIIQFSEQSSEFTLFQLSRIDAFVNVYSKETKNKIAVALLKRATNLRNNFIKHYNLKARGKEEIKKSIHYLEVFIRRMEIILKK